jgi:hypothetical protein
MHLHGLPKPRLAGVLVGRSSTGSSANPGCATGPHGALGGLLFRKPSAAWFGALILDGPGASGVYHASDGTHSQRTYSGKSGDAAGSRNSEASSAGASAIERSMACSVAPLIHQFNSGNTTIEEHPCPAVWLDLEGEHRHGGRQWIEAKWSPHSATISTAVSTS